MSRLLVLIAGFKKICKQHTLLTNVIALSLLFCSPAFASGNVSGSGNKSVSNPISEANGPEIFVEPGSKIFTDVYIYPSVPGAIMLQFRDEEGSWEHRAYWGNDAIPFGSANTVGKVRMGDMPPAERWTRLLFNARDVGLEGRIITGIAYTLHSGDAAWANTGVEAPTITEPPPPPALPEFSLPSKINVEAGKNFTYQIPSGPNTRFEISSQDERPLPSWLQVVGDNLRAQPVPAVTAGRRILLIITAHNSSGGSVSMPTTLFFLSPSQVAEIMIEPSETQTLEYPGGTLQFNISSATNHFGQEVDNENLDCTWRSNNPNIVNIGERSGMARTRSVGEATIFAHCDGRSSSVVVKVEAITRNPEIYLTSPLLLRSGKYFREEISASNGADNINVWSSPDWLNIHNNKTGEVELVADPVPLDIHGEFELDITAQNPGGGWTSAVVTMTVLNPDIPTEVLIKPSTPKTIKYPGGTLQFRLYKAMTKDSVSRGGKWVLNDVAVTSKTWKSNCLWKTSNPDVLTIDSNGEATPIAPGFSTVFANCAADSYSPAGINSNAVDVKVGDAKTLVVRSPKARQSVSGNLEVSGVFRGSATSGVLPAQAQVFWNGEPGDVFNLRESCTGLLCGSGTAKSWVFNVDTGSLNLGPNELKVELRDTNNQIFRSRDIKINRVGIKLLGLPENSFVTGEVRLRAHAVGHKKPSQVEFYLDSLIPSKQIGAVSSGTDDIYTHFWDTCSVSPGPHNIIAIAMNEDSIAAHAHMAPVIVTEHTYFDTLRCSLKNLQ